MSSADEIRDAQVRLRWDVVYKRNVSRKIERQVVLPCRWLDGEFYTPAWVHKLAIRSFEPWSPNLVRRAARAVVNGLGLETLEAADRLGGTDAVIALVQGYKP